jgi:hypothetical protein
MSSWAVAVVVLVAVLVGAWIPVAVQLLLTLRSATRVLGELSHTAQALDGAVKDIGQLTHAASQLQDSVRLVSAIGAAVGPAVGALIHALRTPADGEPTMGDGDHGPGLSRDSGSQAVGLE